MTSGKAQKIFALNTGAGLTQRVECEVAPIPARLVYSALSLSETPLAARLRPTSLLETGTASALIGALVQSRPHEAVRLASESLELIQAVASALPTDAEDERIVDALVGRKTAALKTKPLRRRGA